MRRAPLSRTIDPRVALTPRVSVAVRRWGFILALLAVSNASCSRPFWRTQADFDSYNLLFEKTTDPRWNLPRLTLEADPRARIHDPYDPDLAPLPPDDATAHQYMHWVDGMRGYKSWHKLGQEMSVENPQWLAQFDLRPEDFDVDWIHSEDAEGRPAEEPPVPTIRNMTLEQAIELANINSRDYQFQLENTYLAALALTFARFQFNVRYLGFGAQEPRSSLNYFNTPGTADSLEYAKTFGVSQLLPTGGQWIVEIANNTLWLFSSPNTTSSSSILSYSLVQPLLAGGGRKVVLENLTLTERQLLYSIRTLARFRKIFFSNTVVNDGPSGGGYLGLMQQMQLVENLRSNLREFRLQIEKLREINSNPRSFSEAQLDVWPEGLLIPDELAAQVGYDVDERLLQWRGPFLLEDEERLIALSDDPAFQKAVRTIGATYRLDVFTQDLSQILTQAATTQINLRSAEATLLDNTDSFKLQLGLPTDFQVTFDKSLLKPFELIDPRIRNVEDRLQESIRSWASYSGGPVTQDDLHAIIEVLQGFWEDIDREGLQLVRQDLDRELENRPNRLRRLPDEAAREQVRKNVERDLLLYQRSQEEHEKLGLVLKDLKRLLSSVELPAEDPKEPLPLDLRAYPILGEQPLRWKRLPSLEVFLRGLLATREDLLQIVQGLKVVEVGSRSELITLQDFGLELDDAVALAMENRLDLMNARGAVMDARRNLEVVANQMEGILNVVTRGDVLNTGGTNPFDFRGSESTFQFGMQFTAPLDQVLVRNNYRAAQIEYQRARREYMLLEDTIKRDVRFEWRRLQLNKANFETGRQNIRYAAIQYDVTVENTYIPSRAAESLVPASGGKLNPSGSAGLNLLNALNGILNAQNNLINIWITYERNRINIYRDMDIMVIDERGLWRDPVYQAASESAPPSHSEPADVLPPPPAAGVGGADDDDSAWNAPRDETSPLAAPAPLDNGSRAGGDADRVGQALLAPSTGLRPRTAR